MSGRHAVPWRPRNTFLAEVYSVVLELPDAIVDWARLLAPEPPAAVPATAIAGQFPRVAGPIDAPCRRGVVDSAAAGPIPAAAPRHARTTYRAPSGRGYEPYLVVLDEAATFDETALTVFAPRTARSHINAGSYTP